MNTAFTKYQDIYSLSRKISPTGSEESYGFAVIHSQLATNVAVITLRCHFAWSGSKKPEVIGQKA